MWASFLWQFHFRRRHHELVLALRRSGEREVLDAPAVMLQHAAERRLTRHIAGKADRRWVESRPALPPCRPRPAASPAPAPDAPSAPPAIPCAVRARRPRSARWSPPARPPAENPAAGPCAATASADAAASPDFFGGGGGGGGVIRSCTLAAKAGSAIVRRKAVHASPNRDRPPPPSGQQHQESTGRGRRRRRRGREDVIPPVHEVALSPGGARPQSPRNTLLVLLYGRRRERITPAASEAPNSRG